MIKTKNGLIDRLYRRQDQTKRRQIWIGTSDFIDALSRLNILILAVRSIIDESASRRENPPPPPTALSLAIRYLFERKSSLVGGCTVIFAMETLLDALRSSYFVQLLVRQNLSECSDL